MLKAFGAIAALQQKRLAPASGCQTVLEPCRFAPKDQKRITGQLCLNSVQGCGIKIIRHLDSRFIAPA